MKARRTNPNEICVGMATTQFLCHGLKLVLVVHAQHRVERLASSGRHHKPLAAPNAEPPALVLDPAFALHADAAVGVYASCLQISCATPKPRAPGALRLGAHSRANPGGIPGTGRMLSALDEDATRTQNSLFGIRNLRKPRELSQPNQLDMVGPSRRFSNFAAEHGQPSRNFR